MFNCPHCEYEFEDVSQDKISVYNAKTRILSIKCPECNKNFRAGREESDKLIEKYPELEKEMEQIKVEKATRGSETEDVRVGDFEDKFRDALSIFGLNSKKYEAKIQAILKLIERTGASRDWLKYHMQRFNFINRPTIDSVVDIVFLDEADQPNLPPYPLPGSNQGAGYPGSGYSVQTLPGGQVILIPSSPQAQIPQPGQPIIINPGRDAGDRVLKVGDDEDMVIEELDDEGKVKKRITKSRTRQPSDGEQEDKTLKTLKMLKEMGIIQQQQHNTEQQTAKIPDEIKDTLGSLQSAIARLSASIGDKPTKVENEDLKKMSDTVTKLTEKIENYEREKRDNETKAVKQELGELKGMITALQTGKPSSETPHGLSDTQFSTHTQHKNLQTITDSGEHLVDRIAEPLNKVLEGQNKLNSLIMVRDLERQDNVAPGTYMKVLQPAPVYTDAEVSSTVKRWQERAAQTTSTRREGATA